MMTLSPLPESALPEVQLAAARGPPGLCVQWLEPRGCRHFPDYLHSRLVTAP